ncbi:histidinol dehydrogenase, partial [bacterium]|nr:histidinol dehydrogenase [bacterium]
MIAIKRFASSDADFKQRLDALLAFESAQDEAVERTVAAILADVKVRGDAAVVEYTRRFDRLDV